VRADNVVPCPTTNRAAVLLIETDSISMIGPNIAILQRNQPVIADCHAMDVPGQVLQHLFGAADGGLE
jgi:hypothetical protein